MMEYYSIKEMAIDDFRYALLASSICRTLVSMQKCTKI